MFNDTWVRVFGRAVITTRHAPHDHARLLAELERMSSQQLAGFAHQYLGRWQDDVHETYCAAQLFAEQGDPETARRLADLAAAGERASHTVRAFLTDSLS